MDDTSDIINKELKMEQAQKDPDFLQMLDAFKVRESFADRLKTKEHLRGASFSPDEKCALLKEIIKEKLSEDHPFFQEGSNGVKPDESELVEFFRKNSQYDYFRFSNKFTKVGLTDEQMKGNKNFEQMRGEEEEFRKNNPTKFNELVIGIIKNRDEQAFPDPSKYFWACQQVKKLDTLRWKIDETLDEQKVIFEITIGGRKVLRGFDFKQQKRQAPVLNRQSIPLFDADHSKTNPDEKNADIREEGAIQKTGDVSVDAYSGKGQQLGIRTPAEQGADQADTTNRDFENIKTLLGYNDLTSEQQKYFTPATENDKIGAFVKILHEYRDMPDVNKDLIIER